MNRALLVVAKRPAPGKTKTRLCPPLEWSQAATLYECLLLDTLDLVRSVPNVERIIAYLPPQEKAYFGRLAPDFDLLPQEGSNLGERLDNALTFCLHHGFRQAVIMNSDGPTLPARYLRQAFSFLEKGADVVLGPCQDGGYYLIGLCSPQPGLFRDLLMSTPSVLQETLTRARQNNLAVELLGTWYDVDEIADLGRLARELGESDDRVAKHTRAFLQEHPTLLASLTQARRIGKGEPE